MKTDLTAIAFGHNLEAVKYPWRQTILSVLPVVDEFVLVLAKPNDDRTEQRVYEFVEQMPQVNVQFSHWPDSHTGLGALANLAVEYASTKWVAQAQLDEIFDEADYDELLRLPKLSDNYMAASFGFRHYVGDFLHTFPFVYERVVRAFRTDSDYHFVGDAVQAEGHGDVYAANITVNHVGKVHTGREAQAAFKEFMFQEKLYAHGKCWEGDVDTHIRAAYEEGKLDFFKVFEATVARGDVKEYSGPWCRYVREWAHELGVELV